MSASSLFDEGGVLRAMRQRRMSEVAMKGFEESEVVTEKREKASRISASWSVVMLFSLASLERRCGAGLVVGCAGADGRLRLGGIVMCLEGFRS